MSFLNYFNGLFIVAGLFWAGAACATVPLIVHLLNRRRYRVVQWAAMEFLREAMQRNRRILQIRDLILLALRTLAVLLLGLALAQVRCTSSTEKFDGSRPLYAVLLIDNSLSMGYLPQASLGEDILSHAKQRAASYVASLPADSRVTIIPLCGTRQMFSKGPFTKDEATLALDKIEVVDGATTARRALNEALQACKSGPDLDKRVVLFSDQQEANWGDFRGAEELEGLPPVQVVDVSSPEYENTWVSSLKLQDGLADVETLSTFVVEIKHLGPAARQSLQVTLSVDNAEVGSKTVTVEAGGTREVTFDYQFEDYQPEPGKPVQVPVKASIAPDRLTEDDERHLVVNVVAALPVVFVDQYGSGREDPIQDRLGETRHLRRLLAPVTSRAKSDRQLVKIRHLTIDELSRDVLADARLVVIAGVADPGSAVPLLREYVEQGGQLILAAGADFNPERWNKSAWLDGAGILPAQLASDALGAVPGESSKNIKPFALEFESLATDPYFHLADISEEELRDLYSDPMFFKTVVADVSPVALKEFKNKQMARVEEELEFLNAAADRQEAARANSGALSNQLQAQLAADDERLKSLRPAWLIWGQRLTRARKNQADDDPSATLALVKHNVPQLPNDPEARSAMLGKLAEEVLPRPRARFADEQGTAYLVERPIGQGRVLFASSGLLSAWNTLPQTNAFLIFDRIMRRMIESTLPTENFEPSERIRVPVPFDDPQAKISLIRPGHEDEPEALSVSFIGDDLRGVEVPRPLIRGLYQIKATGSAPGVVSSPDAPAQAEQLLWQLPLAVNGQAEESNLVTLGRAKFVERTDPAKLVWVGPNEEISLAGTQIKGQTTWKYLVLALLLLLFLEMGITSWSTLTTYFSQTGAPA